MGCFDSVYVECPNYHIKVELQSKAGNCLQEEYNIVAAPPKLLLDLTGKTFKCKKGHELHLHTQSIIHSVPVVGPAPSLND